MVDLLVGSLVLIAAWCVVVAILFASAWREDR